MPTLEMQGSYDLNNDSIDITVTRTAPGNYALGYISKNRKFVVKYVGRSDNDLNGRIHQHVDSYERFKYSYATSPKAAFEKECQNYHDFFENLDNENHPDRPDDSNWSCPHCSIFD